MYNKINTMPTLSVSVINQYDDTETDNMLAGQKHPRFLNYFVRVAIFAL